MQNENWECKKWVHSCLPKALKPVNYHHDYLELGYEVEMKIFNEITMITDKACCLMLI